MFSSGRSLVALLGLLTFRAFPLLSQGMGISPAPPPLILGVARLYNRALPELQGHFSQQVGFLPPKRAPARLAFFTGRHTPPFWKKTCYGLFFHLELPNLLRDWKVLF
jgi:hypothetical protein